MRDYLVFAIVFGLLPFILKRPVLGVLVFTWISLMNPHRLTYGAAYNFPFAAIVAAATLFGLFISTQPKRLPFTPATIMLLVFAAWMTLTSFFALEPELVWEGWNTVMKTVLMALVAILVLNTERDIKAFAWVIALSLGFYGFKGGIFTLASGGTNHVLGPVGTYISDNNTLALALITVLPIIWYLHMSAQSAWLRFAAMVLAGLTAISVIGSYSRGALLGGGAMIFLLWLKGHQKLRTGILLIIMLPIALAFMPEQWFERMGTIDNYNEDASAMGRINAWHFAFNLAKDNFLGGGFKVFTPKMFLIYAPEPLDFHVAHSIYFQVLGDHGFVGLALFLLLMAFALRTGARIQKFSKDRTDLKWAFNLAAMAQVSIIGYAVGGAFLSMPYYDLYYYLIALLVLLEKVTVTHVPRDTLLSAHLARTNV